MQKCPGQIRDESHASNLIPGDEKFAKEGVQMLQQGEVRDGVTVETNAEEAMNLLRKAADIGNCYARISLGLRYRRGEGAAREFEQTMNIVQCGYGNMGTLCTA